MDTLLITIAAALGGAVVSFFSFRIGYRAGLRRGSLESIITAGHVAGRMAPGSVQNPVLAPGAVRNPILAPGAVKPN